MNKSLLKKGFFGGSYKGKILERKRKVCILFSGQGTSYHGMYKKTYQNSKKIQKRFQIADELAKKIGIEKISSYIIGEENTFQKKALVESLAQFTLQVGLFEELQEKENIQYISCHSFGEFAGLVCCKIISFEDMFTYIYWREKYSVEGRMMVVFAKKKVINSFLDKNTYIAHENSSNQIVIATKREVFEQKITEMESANIKVIPLSLNKPYHTPLMRKTQEKLQEMINQKEWDISKPIIPFYSSVLLKEISSTQFNRNDILKILEKQVVTQGHFLKQIQFLQTIQLSSIIEISPKSVLKKLIEREIKTNCISIYTSNRLFHEEGKEQKITKKEAIITNKSLKIINKVLKKLTGYEIETISLSDRFEEDLGIDSLKKSEIIFEVMNELEIKQNIDISLVRKISDLTHINNQKKSKKKNISKNFNIFEESFIETLIPDDLEKKVFEDKLEKEKKEIQKNEDILCFDKEKKVQIVPLDILFQKNEANTCINNIKEKSVFIIQESKEREKIEFEKCFFFDTFHKLFLKIIRTNSVFIYSIDKNDTKRKSFGKHLKGFLQSLKKENPDFMFKIIEGHISKKQIFLEMKDPYCGIIKYEGDKRFIPVLKERKNILENEEEEKDSKNSIKEKKEIKKVLLIGGSKGIGFEFLKEFLSKDVAVTVIGRTKKENLSKEFKEYARFKESLLQYESGDAKNKNFIKDILSKNLFDTVMINSGYNENKYFLKKTREEASFELEQHIKPVLTTLEVIKKNKAIKQILITSSITNFFGNYGQSIYALAKGIIEYKGEQIEKSTIFVWPPWEEKGMVTKQIARFLKGKDISLLSSKEGMQLFSKSLNLLHKKKLFYLCKEDIYQYSKGLSLEKPKRQEKEEEEEKEKKQHIFDVGLNKFLFLKDHRINSKIIFPAAGIICYFIHNRALFGHETISEISWIMPLEIKNETNISIYTEPKKNKIDLFLKQSNKNIIKLSLTSKTFEENKIKQTVFKERRKTKKEFSKNEVYKKLFHKGVFQTIQKADFFETEIRTTLSGFKRTNFKQLTLLLDTCFQLLGFFAVQKTNKMYLPSFVQEIFTNSLSFQEKIEIRIQNIVLDESKIKGDVLIITKGKINIFLKEVTLKQVDERHFF